MSDADHIIETNAQRIFASNPCKLLEKAVILINELELSHRTTRSCANDGLIYLGDLMSKSEMEMLRTPGFPTKSLNEVKAIFHDLGVSFSTTINNWDVSPDPLMIERLKQKLAGEEYKKAPVAVPLNPRSVKDRLLLRSTGAKPVYTLNPRLLSDRLLGRRLKAKGITL